MTGVMELDDLPGSPKLFYDDSMIVKREKSYIVKTVKSKKNSTTKYR